ncbi:hypothetical protein GBF38_000718 [Nibea albiflora]|nr:hypothetical protein GBF38_000718 [Nibea albiflora]
MGRRIMGTPEENQAAPPAALLSVKRIDRRLLEVTPLDEAEVEKLQRSCCVMWRTTDLHLHRPPPPQTSTDLHLHRPPQTSIHSTSLHFSTARWRNALIIIRYAVCDL